MIRSFDAFQVPIEHAILDDDRNVSRDVSTGVAAVATEGDMEIGVWEHSVGTSTDTEVEEVFVVLAGAGTVTSDEGDSIQLAPGVVGMLPAGTRTTWHVTEPLRKVWITLS